MYKTLIESLNDSLHLDEYIKESLNESNVRLSHINQPLCDYDHEWEKVVNAANNIIEIHGLMQTIIQAIDKISKMSTEAKNNRFFDYLSTWIDDAERLEGNRYCFNVVYDDANAIILFNEWIGKANKISLFKELLKEGSDYFTPFPKIPSQIKYFSKGAVGALTWTIMSPKDIDESLMNKLVDLLNRINRTSVKVKYVIDETGRGELIAELMRIPPILF